MPTNEKLDPEAGSSREAERRRTILRAAIEVFATKGYHGCRIADVAREAGVAYGLVYHYFKNKEELLSSVFDKAWNGFVHRISEAMAGDGPIDDKVRAIARVAFESYRMDPKGVRVLILEIARSPAGAAVDRHSAFVDVVHLAEGMFQEAKARGELREDADPRLSAALLFGAVEMGLTSFVVGLFDPKNEAELQRIERQVAETFLDGVLAPGRRQRASKSSSSSDAGST